MGFAASGDATSHDEGKIIFRLPPADRSGRWSANSSWEADAPNTLRRKRCWRHLSSKRCLAVYWTARRASFGQRRPVEWLAGLPALLNRDALRGVTSSLSSCAADDDLHRDHSPNGSTTTTSPLESLAREPASPFGLPNGTVSCRLASPASGARGRRGKATGIKQPGQRWRHGVQWYILPRLLRHEPTASKIGWAGAACGRTWVGADSQSSNKTMISVAGWNFRRSELRVFVRVCFGWPRCRNQFYGGSHSFEVRSERLFPPALYLTYVRT